MSDCPRCNNIVLRIRTLNLILFKNYLNSIEKLVIDEEDVLKYNELKERVDSCIGKVHTSYYAEKFLREEIDDFKRAIAMKIRKSYKQ